MKDNFKLKNLELKNFNYALWLALFILTAVFVFFSAAAPLISTHVFFIVFFTAAELILLIFLFFRYSHIMVFLYLIIFFVAFLYQDLDLIHFVVDYCDHAMDNIVEARGAPFPILGFIIYHFFVDLGNYLDFFMGAGFSEAYTYTAISSIITFFLSWFARFYLWIAASSHHIGIALILFAPLLASAAIGLFGAKLGNKFAGYLASGFIGVGAASSFYLWIVHPFIFNSFHANFVNFFKEREEIYGRLYANALDIKDLLLSDEKFSNGWFSSGAHKETARVGLESFKADYDLAHVVSCYVEQYIPFEILKSSQDSEVVVNFGSLFKFYSLEVDWLFKFDNLALTAAFTILSISCAVHVFSCDYMSKDAHASRFFSYLSMFTFFMVMLVLSANMVVFYIAWEGVGLCSFLLISFWFTRAQAGKAALKALLINKIGDVFLLLAAAQAYNLCDSLDFSIIFSVAPITGQSLFFPLMGLKDIDVLCLLLLTASLVKSAQLFFHVWLADAMEGPTPVSALLHAATMVTAGVFLVIRFSFVFEYSPVTLLILVYIGLSTTIVSGIVGMFQYDIKKIIAYSTCSQLGLMFIACGLSGYTFALFHFFNHAFFKALLFLASGVIIHTLNNEQDIRKMGGLRKVLPFTYTVFLIGSLSLVGFPFFSGYFSKDAIVALAYTKFMFSGNHYIIFYLILFSVFLTCFYSFKLIYYVFLGDKTNISAHLHKNGVKEQLNFFIIIPLTTLAVLSVVSGALFKDYFIGVGSNYYYSASIFTMAEEVKFFMFFKEPRILTLFILMLSYVLCTIFAYYRGGDKFEKWFFHYSNKLRALFTFFNKKAFFDDLYNLFIASKLFKAGYNIFLILDKGLLEYFGPSGVYGALRKLSFKIKKDFNKGSIGFLIKFMLLGAFVVIFVGFLFSFI